MGSLWHDILSLLTLLFLEVILGIDNLVFVAIASSSLPKTQQKKARQLGLAFALVTRLLLLSFAAYLAQTTHTLFTLFDTPFSIRSLLFLLGGLFLLFKGTEEIHAEFQQDETTFLKAPKTLIKVILQIAILDIVFSFDSVITAIGMTNEFTIMALAICFAIIIMIVASHSVSDFIEKNPSVKMLAISFILMVGMILIADGLNFHIPRAYIYFTITFSLFVETLNILLRRKKAIVKAKK
jgi:predicted tellurium resistance membrane protein TerC